MGQDLRFAFRMLLKSPAFTAVAVLSLALGIGANTAIFSLVNAALLRPMPVSEPAGLASVFMTDQRNPGNLPLSHLNYKDVREQNQVFADMAAFTFAGVNWSRGTAAEQIPVQVVSGNYFDVLGARPRLGRGFLPEEDLKPTPVAVLSEGFWQRSLGGDPHVIGTTLTLNRTPFTVIGVAPAGFTGTLLGGNPSAFVPMSMHDVVQPNFTWYEQRRGLFLFAFGRLKPGQSVEQANSNIRSVFAGLERAFPTDNKGRGAGAVPLLEARLNPQGGGNAPVVQNTMILMSVVGIVLLIACANIANLLLARATRRRREIAVRLALGAERLRLVRQLLTESLVLSTVGTMVGVLLAYWLLDLLVSADLQLPIPVGDDLSIDARVLAFSALLAVLTGILFGLAPALQASKPDVVPVLKNEIVPSGAGRRGLASLLGLRHALVIAQVALSVMSLVAAGVFLRSLRNTQSTETGFITSDVLVMNVNLGREGYTPERGQIFYQQAAERAATLPGVRAAAVAQNSPLTGGIARSVFPEGEDTTTRDRILVQVNSVSPGFFQTLGIPLLHGRDFMSTDDEDAPLVVVVNETMAERFWPRQDAIGRRFKFFGDEQFTTVIGVARNAKVNALAEDPTPYIYQSLRQNYTPNAALHIRADGQAAGLAAAARSAILELDPTLSLFNVRTLDDQVADSLAPFRVNVAMLATFSLLALALASIGLYGVASYSVSQRTREIGVRMALGAQPMSVLGLVLGRGMILIGVGLVIGLVLSISLAPLIPAALVPFTNVRDPLTLAVTAGVLTIVAVLATYLPARRATRIDPLIALRAE